MTENTNNSSNALNSNQNINSDNNNGNMRPLYSLLPPNEFYNIPENVRNSLPQSSIDDWKTNARAYGYDPNMIHNNMNGMLDFLFEDNANIRIIVNGPTPDCTLFCGPDVARVLGYNHVPHMYDILNEYEKADIDVTNLTAGISDSQDSQHGGLRHMVFITLPGLFRVIARSRHPKAMEFQNWVYHVVLPGIWSYGYYASNNTRNIINADPNMAVEYNRRIEELETQVNGLNNQITDMMPYANMGRFVLNNIHSILISELAKVLNSSGIDIGRNRIYRILRDNGFLMKTRKGYEPTQKSLNMGLMTYTIMTLSNGNAYISTFITPKGIDFFIGFFKQL